jgi:hypothetical protein
LDDPEEEPAPKKKAATRTKGSGASGEYCEYCGIKGHVTQRGAKCQAKESTVKKYCIEDGSLLSGPPTVAAAHPDPEAQLEQDDCEEMDSIPFDFDYGDLDDDDDEDRLLALLLLEDVDNDDDVEPMLGFI